MNYTRTIIHFMRIIDLDSLEIFRAVVAEGGVIRAAGKLNRVQSNVTTRIRQLEERLGHKLFHRQGRSLALRAGRPSPASLCGPASAPGRRGRA